MERSCTPKPIMLCMFTYDEVVIKDHMSMEQTEFGSCACQGYGTQLLNQVKWHMNIG